MTVCTTFLCLLTPFSDDEPLERACESVAENYDSLGEHKNKLAKICIDLYKVQFNQNICQL